MFNFLLAYRVGKPQKAKKFRWKFKHDISLLIEVISTKPYRWRHGSLLRRGFNELYMALTVSNRCVEDAQAETGKAGSETSARSRSKKC